MLLMLILLLLITDIAQNAPRTIETIQNVSTEIKLQVKNHIQRVHNFTCKHPQPRLIPVEDLFNVTSNLNYIPRATVLYRCGDDTGCCPGEDVTCAPSKDENVTLLFKKIDIETGHKTNEELIVKNHTLCICRLKR